MVYGMNDHVKSTTVVLVEDVKIGSFRLALNHWLGCSLKDDFRECVTAYDGSNHPTP